MAINRNDKPLTESSQKLSGFDYKSSRKVTYSPIIDRFVKRIKETFQFWSVDGSRGLSGRAQAIIPRIDVLIDQLKSIDESSGDHYLYSKYIAQPLIREGIKLREDIIASKEVISHQLTSHYIIWIDRSYRWIDKFFKLDSSRLDKAVIGNIIKESRGRVRKDIHLIEEYKDQQLESLDLSEEMLKEFHQAIDEQLEPVIDAMKTIEKTRPRSRDPQQVNLWKENLHMLRQKFFEQCLEIVDGIIEIKSPKLKSREKNEHLVKTLESILSLECSVKELLQLRNEGGNSVSKNHLRRKVAALYQQAHKISLDIRLSQELFDRVQKMMGHLSKCYERLNR